MPCSSCAPTMRGKAASLPCWPCSIRTWGPTWAGDWSWAGFSGPALLYGDGLITPVISVLSALEGLEVATTKAKPLVVPLTCVVLILLFWAQRHGTGRIGKFFGPVMILWFVVLAWLGVMAMAKRPEILAALNPQHALQFFLPQRPAWIFHPRPRGSLHYRV